MGIYGMGKAFNQRYAHRQALPQFHQTRFSGRQPIFDCQGRHSCAPQNVTINNGPKGFWGFLSTLVGGNNAYGMGMGMGFGMPMMCASPLAMILDSIGRLFGKGNNQATGQMQQTQQTQTPDQTEAKQLANLKALYPKFNIVSDGNGNFRATNADGTKQYGPADYDGMCKLLADAQNTPTASTPTASTPTASTPTVSTPTVSTPAASTPAASTPTASTPTANYTCASTPTVSTPGTSTTRTNRPTNSDSQPQGISSSNNTGKKEWTDAEKAKPIRLQIIVASSTINSATTVTVVTPDGKTYKENIGSMGADSGTSLRIVSNRLLDRLKADGWTNVTLENQKFNYSSDKTGPTGNVHKTKDWSPEDKAAYKGELTILFAVRSGGGIGNSGSATVTTPDGKIHQVTTGISLTATRARKDLAEQMIKLLKQNGWQQVTLKNDNFNDWQT